MISNEAKLIPIKLKELINEKRGSEKWKCWRLSKIVEMAVLFSRVERPKAEAMRNFEPQRKQPRRRRQPRLLNRLRSLNRWLHSAMCPYESVGTSNKYSGAAYVGPRGETLKVSIRVDPIVEDSDFTP